MLNIGNGIIYFYSEPINMHKSFEGLSGIVQYAFPGKLFSGSSFVFLNRQRDKIKLLYWDNDGYVILYKRLEKGKFYVSNTGKSKLNRREFLMLFEGIKPKYLDRRFSINKV
jgi:transposase